MNLYAQFDYFVRENGLDPAAVAHQKADGYEMVTFTEEWEEGKPLQVSLVLYDDQNTVEIYTRRPVEESDTLDVYRKVNRLNAQYRGLTFFTEEGSLILKTECATLGNLDIALSQMLRDLQLATQLFEDFH